MQKNQYTPSDFPDALCGQTGNQTDEIIQKLDELCCLFEATHDMLLLICKVLVCGDFRPETIHTDLAAMRLGLEIPRRANVKAKSAYSRHNEWR